MVVGAVVIVFGVWLLSQKAQKKVLVKSVAYALVTAIVWAVSIPMINMAVTFPETGSFDHALAVNTIRVVAVAVFLLASVPVTDRRLGFLKMQRRTLAAIISGGIVALALGWFFVTHSFTYISE